MPSSELAGAWDPSPFVLVGAALAGALYAHGFVRLRQRGRTDLASWDRPALFGAGLSLIVLALVSPLDAIGEEYLLSAHMLQHASIADAGPALIVAGVRGPLLFFLLPAALLAPLARCGPLRRFLGALVRPEIALAVWMAIIAAWHVPAAYEAALTSTALHDLEHASFVLAGLLVWAVLIDPAGRARRAARIAVAAAVFAAGQVLVEILLFSNSALYSAYASQDERLLGLSALTDQRYAGAIMMVEQALTIGLFLLVFFLIEDQTARRRELSTGVPAQRRS